MNRSLVARLALIPVRLAAALVATRIAKRLVHRAWQDAPSPKQRDAGWSKLLLSLVIEGAVFRAADGLVDHASRQLVARVTGTWPGEKQH